MTAARLEAAQISVELGGRRILDAVSMTAAPGKVVGVVGPNGCGKSTMLRALVRILRPTSGSVSINGVDIATIAGKLLAQTVAAVLQDTTSDFDLRVRDVVAMGRAPYKRMFEGDDACDDSVIIESLALVDAAHLIERSFALMSGGERQRVLVARALAQQPGLLVMDEPTNHLDVKHQFEVLALPARLGVTAVIALHDLNLAAHYCDEIYVLRDGKLLCAGPPEAVFTADLMADVWGVSARIQPHPTTGKPLINYNPAVPAYRSPAGFPSDATAPHPAG